MFLYKFNFFSFLIVQSQNQSNNQNSTKDNDWNNSDSNHSQIAISTQRGDFLVEQIKGGAGEPSTYFLSPLNGNKMVANLRRGLQQDYYANVMGEYYNKAAFRV